MTRRYGFALVLIFLSACTSAPKNPWPEAKVPARGGGALPKGSFAIGGYSAGCLSGAVSLPPDGHGFQLMRLSRKRYFAHPDLAKFIERLGALMELRKLGPQLVGDLTQVRGGPTNSNHRSHQSGLDVDLWYLRGAADAERPLTMLEREELSSPSVLSADGEGLDRKRFSKENVAILELISNDDAVERIFVNPVIKRELCISQPKPANWLRKLRPWYGHDDHFHVRLHCPRGKAPAGFECEPQEAIPQGDGCDDTLNWWFSDEAKAKAKLEAAVEIPPVPKLPQACAAVLESSSENNNSPPNSARNGVN